MVAVQDPEDLGRRIEELRTSIVFDDGLTVLSPCAEQHFMLAIGGPRATHAWAAASAAASAAARCAARDAASAAAWAAASAAASAESKRLRKIIALERRGQLDAEIARLCEAWGVTEKGG